MQQHAHLLMQGHHVAALRDVVLDGLQLCLAQLLVDLARILLDHLALLQDGLDDLMVLKLLQVLIHASQREAVLAKHVRHGRLRSKGLGLSIWRLSSKEVINELLA